MPLDRSNLSPGSWVLLPGYIAYFAWKGHDRATIPASEIAHQPALAYADDLLNLHVWGWLYIANAALLATALLVGIVLHRTWTRDAAIYALWLGGITLVAWAIVLEVAARHGQATGGAPADPLFIALTCYASTLSLRNRKRA